MSYLICEQVKSNHTVATLTSIDTQRNNSLCLLSALSHPVQKAKRSKLGRARGVLVLPMAVRYTSRCGEIGQTVHVLVRRRPDGCHRTCNKTHIIYARALPRSHPPSCAHRILQLIVTVFVGLIIILLNQTNQSL